MAPQMKDMSSEMSKRIEAFHTKISTEAENIVFEMFPEKILELQSIIESLDSSNSPFSEANIHSSTDTTIYPAPSSSEGPETKKRKQDHDGNHVALGTSTENARYSGVIHSNPRVDKLLEIIKKESDTLIKSCDKVKLWVNLTMPRYEDGDNFGVEVQTEALSVVDRAQESGLNLRDGSRLHHLQRAKICSKILKYPNVEDYTLSLQEHDEKQMYMARQHLHDLRTLYAVTTDILHKNIGKIRAPKGNNGAALY